MADTERVSGRLGTIEYHARPVPSKPYRSSREPSKRYAYPISITGSIPTQSVRERRKVLDSQKREPEPRKPKGGGRARWAEYRGHRSSDDTYGIRVKITGVRADTYWLPFSKASDLWYEITGANLAEDI